MNVTSTGMVCSVGLGAEQACAALRAGISKLDELPYYHMDGEPVVGAAVPGLALDFRCKQRLVELLSKAVAECLKRKTINPLEKVPLIVGLAESDRPGGSAGLADSIVSEVQEKLEVQFHHTLSTTLPKGHTAGFEALRIGRDLLRRYDVPACLVSGVDSYINAKSILWLERYSRLKTDGNSDGVIPGEAAAVVLVQRAPESEAKVTMEVSGLGFGHEKAHVLGDIPLLGLGLTSAARGALAEAEIQMHEIDLRISDFTGESYGFKEQALAVARLLRARVEDLPIWHCTDSIGDTGAAVGICQLVVAFHALVKDYAPGPRVMCFTSSVTGDRAVAVLQRRTL